MINSFSSKIQTTDLSQYHTVLVLLSRSVVSDSLQPHELQPASLFLSMGIFQARILEWVTMPSSRGSSQPRGWTQVSSIASGFFTSWATREAREYWSGQPGPSPGDFPDPGIKLGSPAFFISQFFISWTTGEAHCLGYCCCIVISNWTEVITVVTSNWK